METLTFKTTIKCGNCVATVTPFLNAIGQIDTWTVDTKSPDRILTVQTTDAHVGDEVKKALEKAGYKAEQLTR